MKVKLNQIRSKARGGFSLIELLVVIAVIGIMAAIAIPMISNLNHNSRVARAKRNAQNAASIANAGLAAGATIDTSSEDALLTALQTGANGVGSFASTVFRVPNIKILNDAETTPAYKVDNYMEIDQGAVVYTGAE